MTIEMRELGVVRVASPCKANWNEMKGDDVKRFCAGCQKNVYQLSNLTADDARELLLKHEGKLCVRFYQRRDGTVLTQDCPTGVRRKRIRLVAALGSAAAMLVSGVAYVLNAGGFVEAGDRLHQVLRPDGDDRRPLLKRILNIPQPTMGMVAQAPNPNTRMHPPTDR